MKHSLVQKSQIHHGKALTKQLIFTKTRNDNLHGIKNLNLWGNDLQDLSLLDQMPNLQVISLSVNNIKTLKYFTNCFKLQELYLRKNDIRSLQELQYIINLPYLKVLWLHDNPCANTKNYRQLVLRKMPNLIKLDNDPVSEEQIRKLLQKNPQSFNESKNHDRQIQNIQVLKGNLNQQHSIKPLVPKNDNFLVNLQQNQSNYQPNSNFTSDRKPSNININQSSPMKASISYRNNFSHENYQQVKKQQDFYKMQNNFNQNDKKINNQSFVQHQQQQYHQQHDQRKIQGSIIQRNTNQNNRHDRQYVNDNHQNSIQRGKFQQNDNFSSVKRVQSFPMSPSSQIDNHDSRLKKSSNILMAVLSLIEQLDNDSLQIVGREISKKLM